MKSLWDTGAQVSLINSKYVKENFPNTEVRPLDTLLHVTAANGSEIPFTGFDELAFSSTLNQSDGPCVIVPFLVTNTAGCENPIIGYNVIEHFVKTASPLAVLQLFSKT